MVVFSFYIYIVNLFGMKYIYCVLFGVCVVASSCSHKDEPSVPTAEARVASVVSSDGGVRIYSYNRDGAVTQSDCMGADFREKAVYDYGENDRIAIEYSMQGQSWPHRLVTYREVMHLEGGRAVYTEGTFEQSSDNASDAISKKYKHEFTYNERGQLVAVKNTEVYVAESATSSPVWNRPWVWEDSFVWEGENLVAYNDCLGSVEPRYVTKFTYFIDEARGASMVGGLFPISYYMPLCQQGVFGVEPKNLVAGVTKTDSDGEVVEACRYDYTLSDGYIKAYYVTARDGSTSSPSVRHEFNWASF